MFCPKCGDRIPKGIWQCDRCGSDMRRILREEFWSESEENLDQPFGERFKMPDHTRAAYQSWRATHPNRRKQAVIIGAVSSALAILIALLFLTFDESSPPEPATDQGSTQVSNTGVEVPDSGSQPDTTPSTSAAPGTPIEQVDTSADEVKNHIEAWRKAWEHTAEGKNVEAYSKFYADGFMSSFGKNKAEFLRARMLEAEESAILIIEVDEPQIKIEGGRIIVTFHQDYLSDRFSDSGIKKLTLVKRGSKLLIVGEEFEDQTPDMRINIAQLKERILEWRTAWESLPIERKLGSLPDYYHPDFRSPSGRNLNTLMSLKLASAKKSTVFTIDIQKIRVSVLGNRAVASFHQIFKSDKYSDVGTKILIFKLKSGKPLIITEAFRLEQKLSVIEIEDFWGP